MSSKGLMNPKWYHPACLAAQQEKSTPASVSPPTPPSRPVPPQPPAKSVADELKKLAELREAGVLTEPEFQAQKAKLLS
jgi:hypothetical protein